MGGALHWSCKGSRDGNREPSNRWRQGGRRHIVGGGGQRSCHTTSRGGVGGRTHAMGKGSVGATVIEEEKW
jgi:hypothetical protein